MNLERIKVLAGIETDAKDELLSALYENAGRLVTSYIGESSLPVALEWVAEELTIIKYNRHGDEGLDSKGVDVVSHTFSQDILGPYLFVLDEYKAPTDPKRWFKML